MRDSSSARRTPTDPMSRLRLVIDSPSDILPPNPEVPDPATVSFSGAERCRVEGQVTGYVYFASPERRMLQVSRRDLAGILKDREFSRAD